MFGFVLVGYRLRVAVGDEREESARLAQAAGAPPVPVKARKVRIWDEEDG